MAEQAINTIYLLGEQPDQLCGDLVKNLTAKAFSPLPRATSPSNAEASEAPEEAGQDEAGPSEVPPTPTPGRMSRSSSLKSVNDKEDHVGAFGLAQLVFAVGHVAIKHIVYLELVEREFKRRKDQKAKGAEQAAEREHS